jgi:hypothetical protein
MRDEWGVQIGFGIKGHPRIVSSEVTIFTSHHIGTTVLPGFTKVRYCPWCGEKISLSRGWD